MQEVWSIFPVNKKKGEVNIWAKNLVSFKKAVKREHGLWTMTDAFVGRWDLVGDNIYGDVYLWWAVPLSNDVMDLFDPELTGAFFKVPAFEDVWEWFAFRGK
jgi:hypothetical protein